MVRSEVIKNLNRAKETMKNNPQMFSRKDIEAIDQAIKDVKRARDMTTLNAYECDPNKARTCKKSACFISGGECYSTRNQEWEYEG